MTKPEHDAEAIKETVRRRYAKAILRPASACGPSPTTLHVQRGCCGSLSPDQSAGCCGGGTPGDTMARMAGYDERELTSIPPDAALNSFGCGNPLAFAGVRAGQTILDIGSGAGIDCFLAAERVGEAGRVIGIDMTVEMIERARRNAEGAGVTNVEFRLGEAEKMPVEDGSVDWVISNCVINLSPDKPAVFREIARVLRPGGRIAISDIVAETLPAAIRESPEAWSACVAGAISEAAYVRGLRGAGLANVRVTSRFVYERAQLAMLLGTSACGGTGEGGDPAALAAEAAGNLWSARFEAVKPQPPEVAASIEIGVAMPADLPAIQSLLRDADLPADVEAHWQGFLVARHAGRPVGCIGMEQHGQQALFRSLAVDPGYQGLGLGSRLYVELEARARARGVASAYLLTTTIVPLAERWGFRRMERCEAPGSIRATREFSADCCASAALMVKDLACGCGCGPG